jgi:hypothetical protein
MTALGHSRRFRPHPTMSASLIGRLGSSAFRLSTFTVPGSLAGSCFSPESAHRPFHHGIRGRGGTISYAALPVAIGRSKPTCELTSSIVPRGTPFHRCGVRVPPSSFGLVNRSRGCSLSGPTELSAINPDAVHDHRQPSRQRDDGLISPAVTGNLHCPGFEPRPFH